MTNTQQNQKCLLCGNFQPYEQGSTITTANGECRYRALDDLKFAGPTLFVNEYWPYIEDGDDFWCSHFKRTTEEPIVQSGQQNPQFPEDWEAFQLAPWNIKESLNVNCWRCGNFQRNFENPNPGQNNGQCRKNATPAIYSFDDSVESGTLEPHKHNFLTSAYWCSQFEPFEGTIPPDPGPVVV